MSVAGVNNTDQTSSTTSSTTKLNNGLDENAFMKMLITELQNQDPSKPMDDTQTIAQLAQFTALQATNNMSTNEQNAQAVTMIGKTVSYPDPTDTTGATILSGTVQGVSFTSAGPNLAVAATDGTITPVALSTVKTVN